MNKPPASEIGELMKCSCCRDDMLINPITNMAHDDELGYVCSECKWNLRVADALLKENRMTCCMTRPTN